MYDIMNSIQKYKKHEQLLLLCSRYELKEEEREYISQLVKEYDFDWENFLGMALINRVNGVVYKNLDGYNSIPKYYVMYFLKCGYLEQAERVKLHQKAISEIAGAFENANMNYAFLKGSVLNTITYDTGDRISNDTDIMVDIKDVDNAVQLLSNMGYIQGKIVDGMIHPATKKEIIFAKLNTYEIVPMVKKVDERYLPFHVVDINFRLGNDDKTDLAKVMLNDTILLDGPHYRIRTLSREKFLIFLCIHHYREATMIYKIVGGGDLTLYKFMDIHHFIMSNVDMIDWEKMLQFSLAFGRIKDVYYTFYYTEMLYPGTFEEDVLNKFRPENVDFLDEYKGRDNTNEVYKWETDFVNRVFSVNRRLEAMKNIENESKRYVRIMEELKK